MNTEIVGCSFDPCERSRRFAEKFSFPFLLICDVDRKVGLLYGAARSKHDLFARRIAYLIDEDGVILRAHADVSAPDFPRHQLDDLIAMTKVVAR